MSNPALVESGGRKHEAETEKSEAPCSEVEKSTSVEGEPAPLQEPGHITISVQQHDSLQRHYGEATKLRHLVWQLCALQILLHASPFTILHILRLAKAMHGVSKACLKATCKPLLALGRCTWGLAKKLRRSSRPSPSDPSESLPQPQPQPQLDVLPVANPNPLEIIGLCPAALLVPPLALDAPSNLVIISRPGQKQHSHPPSQLPLEKAQEHVTCDSPRLHKPLPLPITLGVGHPEGHVNRVEHNPNTSASTSHANESDSAPATAAASAAESGAQGKANGEARSGELLQPLMHKDNSYSSSGGSAPQHEGPSRVSAASASGGPSIDAAKLLQGISVDPASHLQSLPPVSAGELNSPPHMQGSGNASARGSGSGSGRSSVVQDALVAKQLLSGDAGGSGGDAVRRSTELSLGVGAAYTLASPSLLGPSPNTSIGSNVKATHPGVGLPFSSSSARSPVHQLQTAVGIVLTQAHLSEASSFTADSPPSLDGEGVLGLPSCVANVLLSRLDADSKRVLRCVSRALYFEVGRHVAELTVRSNNLKKLAVMPMHEVFPCIRELRFQMLCAVSMPVLQQQAQMRMQQLQQQQQQLQQQQPQQQQEQQQPQQEQQQQAQPQQQQPQQQQQHQQQHQQNQWLIAQHLGDIAQNLQLPQAAQGAPHQQGQNVHPAVAAAIAGARNTLLAQIPPQLSAQLEDLHLCQLLRECLPKLKCLKVIDLTLSDIHMSPVLWMTLVKSLPDDAHLVMREQMQCFPNGDVPLPHKDMFPPLYEALKLLIIHRPRVTVDLVGVTVRRHTAVRFPQLCQLSCLTGLSLFGKSALAVPHGHRLASHLRHIAAAPMQNLRSLELLSYEDISDAELAPLADCPVLEHLYVDSLFVKTATGPSFPSIKSLTAARIKFILRPLTTVFPSMKRLRLGVLHSELNKKISSASLSCLAGCSNVLEELVLCPVMWKGQWQVLPTLTGLKRLVLVHCKELTHLREVLKVVGLVPSLEYLELQSCCPQVTVWPSVHPLAGVAGLEQVGGLPMVPVQGGVHQVAPALAGLAPPLPVWPAGQDLLADVIAAAAELPVDVAAALVAGHLQQAPNANANPNGEGNGNGNNNNGGQNAPAAAGAGADNAPNGQAQNGHPNAAAAAAGADNGPNGQAQNGHPNAGAAAAAAAADNGPNGQVQNGNPNAAAAAAWPGPGDGSETSAALPHSNIFVGLSDCSTLRTLVLQESSPWLVRHLAAANLSQLRTLRFQRMSSGLRLSELQATVLNMPLLHTLGLHEAGDFGPVQAAWIPDVLACPQLQVDWRSMSIHPQLYLTRGFGDDRF